MRNLQKARNDLLEIFESAVSRVDGQVVVRRYLQRHMPDGPVSVVALGKAAQSMARGAEAALGERLVDGLVITKQGHLDDHWLSASRFTGMEGGHPVPDQRSLEAGSALLDFLAKVPAQRPLLFLISGGTSSLVEVLDEGVGLDQLQRLNQWLLGSGLAIGQMNLVRKGVSRIKGGGLRAFLGEREVTALLISDVPGDDPAVIGSGLLVKGETAPMPAALPEWVQRMLHTQGKSVPDAVRLELAILADLRMAREAAADKAKALGYQVKVNHAFISADAANAGQRLALELLDARPGVYIWGGEPSVRLPPNPGRGGRNQHLALSAATLLEGCRDVCFLSAGTDGSDGPGEDAGALVDGATVNRGRREGLDADDCLLRADAGAFLAASGDLVYTGPTGTNVMDLMLGLKFN